MIRTTSNLTDLSAEAAVLGSILLKPDVLDEISFLEPRDFSSKRHELIFSVMRYLWSRDRPVDVVTITEHFMKRNRIADLGGPSYLAELLGSVPTAEDARHYAEIVRSKAHRRRGVELAQKIIEASQKDYESDEDYFAAVDALVDEIRPQDDARMASVGELRETWWKELMERKKGDALKTGFAQYDAWAEGIWRGWLYVLAGRPSAGKTAMALQLAYGIARHNPKAGPVLIFSQEMGNDQILNRLVSNISGVNYRRITTRGGEEGFREQELEAMQRALDELDRLQIHIRDSAGITYEDVASTVRRFHRRHGRIGVVVLDYLQIMSIRERRGERRDLAIGRVTKGFKELARRYNFPFILLSQLNRESERAGEPKLADLRDSGSIEQDADVVQFLWHDGDMHGSAKVVESIFAKGRDIGTRKFRLAFEWWIQRFRELERKEEPASDGKRANRKSR